MNKKEQKKIIVNFIHNREELNFKSSWQETYSKLAGNEIHSIVAEGSKFFQEFIGQSFSYASYLAHTK